MAFEIAVTLDSGEIITIRKKAFGDYGRMIRMIRDLFKGEGNIVDKIENNFEEVIPLLSFSTEIPPERFTNRAESPIGIFEVADLLKAVWDVNGLEKRADTLPFLREIKGIILRMKESFGNELKKTS